MYRKVFKSNFVRLSQKLGGPYALIRKGINRSIVQGIMRGSLPSIQNAYQISQVLEVSIEHLLTGSDPQIALLQTQKTKNSKGFMVPIVEGPIPLGLENFLPEKIVDYIWIPSKLLKPFEENQCRYVGVVKKGKAMEPLIRDKALVILDRKENNLRKLKKGEPYAVLINNSVKIRFLLFDPDQNQLQVFPFNPNLVGRQPIVVLKLNHKTPNPVLGTVAFTLTSWK